MDASDDDILRSLEGLEPAEASPFLYTRVRQRLESRRAWRPAPIGWALRLAVAMLTLLTLANLLAWRSLQETPQAAQTTAYAYPAENYVF